jgi:hypothetical protein
MSFEGYLGGALEVFDLCGEVYAGTAESRADLSKHIEVGHYMDADSATFEPHQQDLFAQFIESENFWDETLSMGVEVSCPTRALCTIQR